MGKKIGYCRTLDDDQVKVTFSGDNVNDGEIVLNGITLQMDGNGREYEAVKVTTATVTCTCDGLALLDLFTDSIAVSVKIENTTTGAVIFSGYVTPNTFSQSLSGINDDVAIECVDALGAGKFIYYRKKNGEDSPFCAMTVVEAVLYIAGLLGIKRVYLGNHITVQPRHGEYSTTSYEKLTLAEQYFYADITPRRVHVDGQDVVTYAPEAMTCYEALEMIAASFYSTWVQIGENLYMHDYAGLRATGYNNFKEITSAGSTNAIPQQAMISLNADSFDEGATNISVLPRYTLFSVEHQQEEQIDLFPDMFRDELFQPREIEAYSPDDDTVKLSMPLSGGLTVGSRGDIFYFNSWMAITEVSRPDVAKYDKSGYWKYKKYGSEWTNTLTLSYETVNTGDVMATLQSRYVTAVPARFRWRLRLSIEIAFGNSFYGYYYPNIDTGTGYDLLIQLLNNGLYYNEVTQLWTPEPHYIKLTFPADGKEWRSLFYWANKDNDAVAATYNIAYVENPGNIELRIVSKDGFNLLRPTRMWIRKLQLSIVDPTATREAHETDPLPEIEYRGSWGGEELETVSLPIDIVPTLANKSFGTLIDGVEYCEGIDYNNPLATRPAAELRYNVNGVKQTLLERIETLANAPDNYELTIPLHDHHNEISALQCISSPLWNGNKAIVAIEKNILENSINVTIN
ncbi:MAG: hypothetical protein J6V47_05500 [Bacteroidaceae bacterium]|nr:hypothetical protein [Bacteroidaceae bacterium]